MVTRKDVGSWVEGPGSTRPEDGSYAGQRLGMPARGPGSIARFGRRLVAIVIDWLLCTAIGVAFFGAAFAGMSGHRAQSFGETLTVPLILLVENVLLVGTIGFTVGHRVMGLRVVGVEGAPAGPVRGLVRSVLLVLAVPALIWDRDGRGLHDKAARTVLIRMK